MELLVIGIAIGCAIGVAVSLIAWIPPLRRMGQASAQARKGLVFGLGVLAGWLVWLVVTGMLTQGALSLSWTGVEDDFATNQSSLLYDAEVLQNWDVIRREIWLRSVVPPPLHWPCFTGNDTACRWADQLGAGWRGDWGAWRDYLLVLLIGFGFPAILSGALAWYATRQKRVNVSEQDPPY